MCPSTKRCSSIFDLGPQRPKFSSQDLHKIAYKSACMADRPDMFGPTRGFSEMADSMEPCKMLWADPCCHDNEIWARRGDPVAYRLVSVNSHLTSLRSRQSKIHRLQVGRHGSEPGLPWTTNPPSPIVRWVRNAGLESSVMILSGDGTVEMSNEGQMTDADSV